MKAVNERERERRRRRRRRRRKWEVKEMRDKEHNNNMHS